MSLNEGCDAPVHICLTDENKTVFCLPLYICFMELIFQADIALIFRIFLLGQRKSTKEYFVYFEEIFCRTSGKRQKSAYGCPVKSIPKINDNRRKRNNHECSFVHPGRKSWGPPRLNSWQ